MGREAINHIDVLVKRQFETMSKLVEIIRALKESGKPDEAARLALILDKLSESSLEIGRTIRGQVAA